MILRKHIPLKAKYLAFIGLITLPTISFATDAGVHSHRWHHHPKKIKTENTVNATEIASPSTTSSVNVASHKEHMSHKHHMSAPKVGGVAAFNYSFDDTGINKVNNARKYGDWRFNEFKVTLSGDMNDLCYNFEYAWFRNMLANLTTINNSNTYNQFVDAHVGYKFSNGVIGQVGNTKVPFGNPEILGFWHNMAYWAGFGNNYQAGLKMMYMESPWGFEMQLGKNSLVNSNNASTYFPKLTTGLRNTGNNTNQSSTWYAQNNEDSVQLTARVIHSHHFHDKAKLSVGLSGRFGNTYNTISTQRGTQWAAALHANAAIERWVVQLQFLPYRYSPNYSGSDAGIGASEVLNTVQLGKDGVLYTIPDKANIWSAGLGYKFPVSWGKIEEVLLFDEYSVLSGKNTKKNSKMNTVGFMFNVGPLYLTAEAIAAKNMVGVGQGTLPDGSPAVFNIGGSGGLNYGLNNNNNYVGSFYDDNTDHWKTKFNINIAAKF